MEQFELLKPMAVRPEEEQDRRLWQPSWKCFCCQDTGKISPDLVRRVMPNYNYSRDRLPICQHCDKGRNWIHLSEFGVIDTRITFETCRKLDAIAREDWRCTTQALFDLSKKRIEEETCYIAQIYSRSNTKD